MDQNESYTQCQESSGISGLFKYVFSDCLLNKFEP